jgi:hypothetical protein
MVAERRLDLETSFADDLEELVPDLAEATAAALQEILQLGLMMHFQEVPALGSKGNQFSHMDQNFRSEELPLTSIRFSV